MLLRGERRCLSRRSSSRGEQAGENAGREPEEQLLSNALLQRQG